VKVNNAPRIPRGNPDLYRELQEHASVINRLCDRLSWGSGSPEGVISSSPGALYLNTDGGASTTLYVKESGTGTTGWVAK
jgi:hypothetical protein